MSNTELCKFYMGLLPEKKGTKMPEVPYTDIIPALDKYFGELWTWELADERFAMDNTMVCTTVTLYTPGRVYTGRSLCKIKDYHTNHLFAILDACQTFISKQAAPQNTSPQPAPGQQMTTDQIMSALGQTAPTQQVNTAAQFYNYKDNNGVPLQGVPMDAMTENCHKELQQEVMNPSTPPQAAPTDYDAPLEKYKGFSQRQIDRLNKFKKDFDILNDEMFGNYVNTWDKTLTSKSQITPANADAFLAWAESLGKMDC